MNNYLIQTLFLFLIVVSSCGVLKKNNGKINRSQLLVGEWKYVDVYEKEDMNPDGLKVLELFFGDMWFNFDDKNQFEAVIMEKEGNGTWELNATEDVLLLSSKKDGEMEIKIIELTNKQMVIQFEKASFVMKKVDS